MPSSGAGLYIHRPPPRPDLSYGVTSELCEVPQEAGEHGVTGEHSYCIFQICCDQA